MERSIKLAKYLGHVISVLAWKAALPASMLIVLKRAANTMVCTMMLAIGLKMLTAATHVHATITTK
jgi:hypothetical protein